jgi:alcohol dehydrogenase
MRLEVAGLSATDAAQRAVAALVKLNEDLQVPRLRDCNISREALEQALPKMAADALASGSPANNPRVPTPGEIIELYRQAY